MHLGVLARLTGLERDAARTLAVELIAVGLGEDMGDGHLRLDPGLPPYALGELAADEAEALRSRWAEAMGALTRYLYGEHGRDAHLASRLTLLELPNLLAMLEWLQERLVPEQVVALAAQVETLVADLGQPRALARATQVRERAAQSLDGWSHARYIGASAAINRLLETGNLPAALAASQELLTSSVVAGETAYPEASYDLAAAYSLLGRVQRSCGAAGSALEPLAEARRRFEALVEAGNTVAGRMVSLVITDTADCLLALGRLDDAAEAYEHSIMLDQHGNRVRDVAIGKAQLGTVRLLQKRFGEALDLFEEARTSFAAFGEPLRVAGVWHQIGMAYQDADQFERAEDAYRKSLAISVREEDLSSQAGTLNQLASLYQDMNRPEEAVTFLGRASDAFVQLGDKAHEGMARNNLGYVLLALGRFQDARAELERALECMAPYGHAAQSWKTWSLLHDLERATDHPAAALAARKRAIAEYMSYRRAGGDSESHQAPLFFLVAQAVQDGSEPAARERLNALLEPGDPPAFTALLRQLQAVLAGARDPALAADPELSFREAAELLLLLEALAPDVTAPGEPGEDLAPASGS